MVGYNYRAHWGAKKTPLYVAVLDFFANHPDYKITADEFASLVSMLSSMVLEKA